MKTKTNYLLGILLSTFLIIGIINTTNGITIDTNPDTSKLHTPSLFSLLLGNSSNPVEMSVATGSNNLDILNGLIIGKNHTVTGSPKLSVIGGGGSNTMNGNYAGIGGGEGNKILNNNGVIGGGYKNKIEGPYGIIGGGNNNKASNYGIILGGNSNTSNNYGIILGGKSNSGNNSLVLGSNAKGQNYSFAWNGSASANSARINTTGGMLIGTYDPIAGVSLVVSGAIKISSNNSSNSSGGIFVDTRGCIQFYDGNVKNTLGDVSKNNNNCGINTGCKFGEATLHNGDKVTAYSVSYAKDCQSASGEAICKNGNMVDYKNQNSHKFIYPYCYDLSPDPIIVVNDGYQECREGLPEHAEWVNPYFNQTLNGDTYEPQQPNAHFDLGNGNPCSYKCEEGYVYIENQCIRPQATCKIDSDQRLSNLNNSDLCINGSVDGDVITKIEELDNKYQAKRSWTCKNDYNSAQCSAIRPTANFYTYDDGSDLTFRVTKDIDWNADNINFSGVTIYVNGSTTSTIKFQSTNGSYKAEGLGGAEMTNQNSVRYGNQCRNRSGVESSNCANPTNKLFWVKDGYVIIGNNKLSDKNIAYLITGESINNIMRNIAGSQINNYGYPRDMNIKYVKTYTGNPDSIPSSARTISTTDSPKKVKMWYNNGTIYYYTDASKIYLNSDSSKMFTELRNVQTIDTSGWDTSKVTNMNSMFGDCFELKSLNTSGWNTSNVENMHYMFGYCHNLTGLNVSNWNTSKVKDMSDLFIDCRNLENLNVSGWKTNNVENMENMFFGCNKLKKLDVSEWNTSKVTDMDALFMDCDSLTGLDVSKWDTSKVTDMADMFNDSTGLIELDLSNWDTSIVQNMHNMFYKCENLTKIYTSDKFIVNQVTSSDKMFQGATNLSGQNGTTYTGSHVDKTYARLDCGPSAPGYFSSKTPYSCNNGEPTLDVAYLITGSEINNIMKDLTDNHLGGITNFKMYTGNPDEIPSTAKIISTDEGKEVKMWYEPHSNTYNIIYYYTDASTIYMNPDSSRMFENLSNLKSLDFSQGNWNTSRVTNMEKMFWVCSNLQTINFGSGWNTSKVTNMIQMFAQCESLKSLDFSKGNWDTSNVTNMNAMFASCSNLQTINFGNKWDTSNVTNMNLMFGVCQSLKSLDFSKGNWDTSNVTGMAQMFYSCQELTSLDFSKGNWNTSNVTSMEKMFESCYKLETINFGNNWNTSKVTDMTQMFANGYKLTTLDFSKGNWDTSKVKKMTSMFNGMGNLTTIYVSDNFKVDQVTNSSMMFYNDKKLKGKNGTQYDESHTDKTYARRDCGPSAPGYFSSKTPYSCNNSTYEPECGNSLNNKCKYGTATIIDGNSWTCSNETSSVNCIYSCDKECPLGYTLIGSDCVLHKEFCYIHPGWKSDSCFGDTSNHYKSDGDAIEQFKNDLDSRDFNTFFSGKYYSNGGDPISVGTPYMINYSTNKTSVCQPPNNFAIITTSIADCKTTLHHSQYGSNDNGYYIDSCNNGANIDTIDPCKTCSVKEELTLQPIISNCEQQCIDNNLNYCIDRCCPDPTCSENPPYSKCFMCG